MEKIYKKINLIFFIFIGMLLVQAFDQTFGWGLNQLYPNYYFYTFGTIVGGWNLIIWNENGIVEIMQALILICATIILIRYYFNKKKLINKILIKTYLILNIIFLILFLLEEISYGQHFINFETLSIFLDKNSFFYNTQQETNLHNTSRLFNQIPRSIVVTWCCLSIFIFKKINLKNYNYLKMLVIPSEKLIWLSWLLILFVLPNLIFEKLMIIKDSTLLTTNPSIKFNYLVMLKYILTYNFFRLSELQELIIAYYFFWHALFLTKIKIEKY